MASWSSVKSGMRDILDVDEYFFHIDSYDNYDDPWYKFQTRLSERMIFDKSQTWEFCFDCYNLMPKEDFAAEMLRYDDNCETMALMSIGFSKLHFVIELKTDEGVKQSFYRSSLPVQTLPLYLRVEEDEKYMYNDVLELDHFDSTAVRIYADKDIDFLIPFYYPTLTFTIRKQNVTL